MQGLHVYPGTWYGREGWLHHTVYALTFAGLNFRGSQVLAIFAFLFSRMQGLILWFVDSSFPLNPCHILMKSIASVAILSCIWSYPVNRRHFCIFVTQSSYKWRLVARQVKIFAGSNFRGWLLIRENRESLTPRKLKRIRYIPCKEVIGAESIEFCITECGCVSRSIKCH